MTTQNDFIRQASHYTMGGLIDPKLIPGYAEEKSNTNASRPGKADPDIIARFRRLLMNLIYRKPGKRPAHL